MQRPSKLFGRRLDLLLVVAVCQVIAPSCRPCPEQTGETAQSPGVLPSADAPTDVPPLIGVSGYVIEPGTRGDEGLGNYRVTRTYRDAVTKSGGYPVHLIPVPTEEIPHLLDRVDGVILAGGPDVDPRLYGEEPHPSVSLIPAERQDFDIGLAREAVERGMPILGVCLGSQELNVALGGSLIQDIPSEVGGEVEHSTTGLELSLRGVHEVTFVEGTLLAGFYEEGTIRVNSLHHQASDVMGEGLVIAARAPDGVVEGFFGPAHPFLVGVQYHPEIQNDPPGLHDNLLRAFIEAASSYRARRSSGAGS